VVGLNPNRTADIVDQHVDSAMGIECLLHQALRAGERAQINDDLHRFDTVVAQFGQCLCCARVDAVSQYDLSAFFAQTFCCRPSNSLSGASYDAHLIGKPTSAGCPGV